MTTCNNTFSLDQFYQENPTFPQNLIIRTEGENSRWARIKCAVNEQTDKSSILKHIYFPIIDLQTGGIYLDCSKKTIYKKLCVQALLRPFHIVFKTFYHLAFPISIPHIIYKTIKLAQKDAKEKKEPLNKREVDLLCFKKIGHSLADIIRTPLYGLAIIIVSIAAVLICSFAFSKVYDFREKIGSLITKMQRGDNSNDLSPCFVPFRYLSKMGQANPIKYMGVTYPKNLTPYEHRLISFAWAQIHFLRNNYAPFHNPIPIKGRLDPNIAYVSSSYCDFERK